LFDVFYAKHIFYIKIVALEFVSFCCCIVFLLSKNFASHPL